MFTAATAEERDKTNFTNNEYVVHLRDEVDSSALRWIVSWIDGIKDEHYTDIENMEGDRIFDQLIALNFLQMDELVQKCSRIIVKNLDESNFIPAWYNAKTYGIASLGSFVQNAFFDAPDRNRVARYGCYDFNIKVYDFVLKCHKIVYLFALNDQAVNSDNLPSTSTERSLCDQVDLTCDVLKYYTPNKDDVPVR